MFVIDGNNELVGFSRWPSDSLYAPVIACFFDGRLEGWAICDREPQRVRLSGPPHRTWFRMRVRAEVREAIEDGRPNAILLRFEDGARIQVADVPSQPLTLRRVEDMLACAPSGAGDSLNGFPAFVAAPRRHQLDVVFLDYLGRCPDPDAQRHYDDQMEHGFSILDVRNDLLRSEEFGRRAITPATRPGALITSSLWNDLALAEPLGERRPRLRTIRITDYDGQSDEDFARNVHRDCHGDEPSAASVDGLAHLAREHGRTLAASLLVRDAANGGRFLLMDAG